VGGCRSLAFKPTLGAFTDARTSYAGGAGLDVKLAFPKTPEGTEANLAQMKISLPKQLPSRLTTLQGSCPDTAFAANPAACPGTSIVGVARARTPILPGLLAGPVYLVSHGPTAFPSPVVVLEGDGVVLELPGSSTVGRASTSVTFKTVPDIPVQSIEIYLPQGPHSLLSANANLCALAKTVAVTRTIARRMHGRTVHRRVTTRKRLPPTLPMPASLIAQNGLVLHRAAHIDVRGCGVGRA
jgi:hypothetical protein